MKIGILGSGMVGQTLSAGFLKHGHQVMLGTRDSDKPNLQEWRKKKPAVQLGNFEQAAKFGELTVLCSLGHAAVDVLRLAGPDNLAGKTIIDTTNPLAGTPPVDGVIAYTTGPNQSLAEQIQAAVPRSHVVKAFNSVGNARMVNPHYEQGTPTMFICGNNADAKTQVSAILQQFGWEPYDCGAIIAARAIEPLCMLWCIPGFLHNQWGHAFKLFTH
jgi:predicted dinucleotide-binding enzyme